jgi:predicted Zn-dependent protease
VQDDIALGEQVAAQTDSTYRAQGKLLERNAANARAYALLDPIVNRVLNSGQLQHRNDFVWDVKIIRDPNIQNAFATPGGHIYVFSGLIDFLENETSWPACWATKLPTPTGATPPGCCSSSTASLPC